VAAIVDVAVVIALGISLLSTATYDARARIGQDSNQTTAEDPAAADRRLATVRELITSPAVLDGAAKDVPGETASSLAPKVSVNVDTASGIVDVVATDTAASRAARIADAVATTFLQERARRARLALKQASDAIAADLAALRKAGNGRSATAVALGTRLGDLMVQRLSSGSDLRLVEAAAVPSAPAGPGPVRVALLAALAGLILAIPLAVYRDRRRTPPPDAATLSSILRLPVLATLPARRPRRARGLTALARRIRHPRRRATARIDRALLEEMVLSASICRALDRAGHRLVVVHGIHGSDGVPEATAALVRTLRWTGRDAVLVSDRDAAGVPSDDEPADDGSAARVPVLGWSDIDGREGVRSRRRHRLLVVDTTATTDGPRLHALARHAPLIVVLAHIGRATVADAVAARRMIDALGFDGLGLVVTGARRETSALWQENLDVMPPPHDAAAPMAPERHANGSASLAAHTRLDLAPGSKPASNEAGDRHPTRRP
jgi:capsular polysaccharide biosynthesis protein